MLRPRAEAAAAAHSTRPAIERAVEQRGAGCRRDAVGEPAEQRQKIEHAAVDAPAAGQQPSSRAPGLQAASPLRPRKPGGATRQAARPRRRTAGQRTLSVRTAMPSASMLRTERANGSSAKRRSISSARPSACSAAAAIRHGSRAARSPPGAGSGARWPSRSKSLAVDAEQLAAPGAAVGTEPEAVERKPEHRPVDAMLGRQSRRHGRDGAAPQ